jgi:putative aldouronate transport system substrate-binding protein
VPEMLNRRQFLERAALAAGALGAPALLLQACAPTPRTAGTSGTSTGASSGTASGAAAASTGSTSVMPTYVPFPNKPKPDYPSAGDPYMDGYDNYPSSPVKSITGDVGQGSTVTAMTIGLFPPPTPYENNPAWQAINKELNVDFKMNIVAPGDYTPKLATVMAGNDMPDLLFFYYNQQTAVTAAAGVPQFLEAQGADLTPYLAGDAIKDYPALANIPTRAWKNSGSVYNGKVTMVPKPLYSEGFVFLKNATQWDTEIGQDYVPTSADDYKRVLLALTRPAEGRYGTAAAGASSNADAFGSNWYSQWFGAPNQWRLGSDGKLTRSFETPEYKETIAFLRDLYASGVYHPNTAQMSSGPNGRADFVAGKWTVWLDGFATAWSDPWRRARQASTPFEVHMIPLFPAHDGVKPVHHMNAAHLGATAIKKGSPERVKELLRVLNYLAAPFGSQEDLLLSYGVEGPDYTMDARGNPVLTERGNPDANYLPFKYIAQHPSVLYVPDIPDYTRVLADAEKKLLPIGITDPTVGFVSPTGVRQGVVVNQTFMDGMRDIIVNRRPFSDFDQLVSDWRSNGGDTIRKEFQDAIAAAK